MKTRLLLLATLAACSPATPSSPDLARWEARARNTTIIRDNWGIPHVYGKTDADAVFGLLYAQSEDDFNRVETNYILALGRMAEVAGKSALYADLRMRLFIDTVEVKKEYEKSPEWLKALMVGFADGVNYYLHTHPEVKPRLLSRFEPWMALTFSEGSIGGDIESVPLDGIEAFYGGGVSPKPKPKPVAVAGTGPDLEPRGSNGIAIAPANSATGNALLLINPHTSFYFRPEVQMVSDEGLHAYGAVTWGQFFIYQGFNEHNGWMHTSSAADVIDWYAESVVKTDRSAGYRYGNEVRPFTEKTIRLPFRDGDSTAYREFTAYFSHHGPVVREEGGKWVSVKLMVEHEKALTQSFLRTKTQGYDEFRKVMDLRTNSSNNTVFADGSGNIAYFHGNFMPKRDPRFDWAGVVDGSDPATEWQGLHSVDETVHLHNPATGWIQNCNSTPFTASGSASPKRNEFPGYMAPDDENARGIHAVRVLENRKGFTVESLIEAAYDSYLTGFEPILPGLLAAYDRLPPSAPLRARLSEPIDSLRSWNLRFSVTSVPTTVAVYWGEEMVRLARAADDTEAGSVFDYIAAKAPAAERLGALVAAVEKLEADFGTWKTGWGEVNRFQRLTGEIVPAFNDSLPSLPVGFASAQWGSLASFGSRSYGTRKMYGTSGNSFVAVVEFGPRVRAKSVLAGGVSGDPKSPHFYDQAEIYARGQFKDVLFYREDVEKHAERTYRPGFGVR